MKKSASSINSWKDFAKSVRSKGCSLLKRLDSFPDSILVTGCQRSGATILSRILTQSDGMVDFSSGEDDELDAALILSGFVEHTPRGRYCFQTTYLNECYMEYFHHRNGAKIIWVLRNPYSVVYSMLHNWRSFALNELFLNCGSEFLTEKEKKRMKIFGKYGVNKLRKACCAYVGKTRQVFALKAGLSADAIMFVEYDDLVKNRETRLPAIYDFIGLTYHPEYAERLHRRSLKKAMALSARERAEIARFCDQVFGKAMTLVQKV